MPGHLELLPALVGRVRPGGWLAFQVPGNFDEPSHTIRRELADEAPYAAHTRDLAAPAGHDPATYLEALAGLGCTVDAWETTYLHVLTGEDPVFTWVSGTGARPTLQALPDDLRPGFEAELKRRLRAAYPPAAYGVVLPFRRVFVVARTGTVRVARRRRRRRPEPAPPQWPSARACRRSWAAGRYARHGASAPGCFSVRWKIQRSIAAMKPLSSPGR